jgi:hypothetical protein
MVKKINTRRMTDIDRLAAEYKRNVEAITGEYQQSFGAFQAEQTRKMEPYNVAAEQYKTAMGEYEKQAADYRGKLTAYQKAIEDFPTSAGEKVNAPTWANRGGSGFVIGGRQYRRDELPTNYFIQDIMGQVPETVIQGAGRGARRVPTGRMVTAKVGEELRMRTPPGAFTEKAPTAPTAPTMPELGEFDASALQAKRGQAETTFKREVAERKAARLGAVGRRITRPMLQES